MNISLTGLHAIVCGSTQGIGRAIAELYAEQGASVTLVARNKESLDSVKSGLAADDGQTHYSVCADFSDPNGLAEVISAHMESIRTAHILVNNTGGPPGGALYAAEQEAFTSAFKMHILCSQLLVQATLEGMKSAGYGRIINIISTSVKQPIPGIGVSNTIRGAMGNWAKTLSLELASFGITVNNVLPGATTTARLPKVIQAKANTAGKTFEEAEAEWMAAIPARRFAEPREIANAAAFLASPAASYINGINLPVDGGRTGSL